MLLASLGQGLLTKCKVQFTYPITYILTDYKGEMIKCVFYEQVKAPLMISVCVTPQFRLN